MELRLFGEVELRVDGGLLDVGTPRQQAVLAALAVDAGRPVAVEMLIDRVWNDDPPVQARNVLYSHLSRIRQLLREAGEIARVDRRNAGYVLDVDPELVDLHRFSRLVEVGRDARGQATERAAVLTEALGLWRGIPLAGVTGDWVEQVRDSWHRRRLDAIVLWGQVELELGRFDGVIGALPDLVAEYPLAEQLEGLLMRALHAAGRDAEAVERYSVVRKRFAEELGTDPGPELRALHSAILRGDLPSPGRERGWAAPAQLPPDVPGFAGRADELRSVGGGAGIVVVSGTAGVGKTTLAVHWAHQARAEFPGGQLYVNLRGFDPTGSPVTPSEAVRGFLDAFEVPSGQIPASLEAQVGLYRSLLANRRVLVVLDNARDAGQVRPLLPGAPGCLALVTSRSQMAGLVTEGARSVPLDLLDDQEARDLLAGRLSVHRTAAEPGAVDEIVALCARLPLALAVVAARAAMHPRFPLAALARELHEARGGLDEFSHVDPATDPRAVFSWSYLQLTAAAARLFRLTGLHPGPDLGTRAAASLAGLPVAGARPLLAELADAHLLAEHSPGRYTCHDLLRTYASEQARTQDPEPERHAATRRMLGHYVHSANHADGLLDPRREEPPALTPPAPGVVPEQAGDHGAALAWFRAERRVLLAAVRQPVEFDAEVWELAWTMRRFLAHQGHWHDEIESLTVALAAARRLGDPLKQAFAQCYVGCTQVWLEKFDDARFRFAVALDLYRDASDQVGQAHVRYYLCWMLERQERVAEALAQAEQGLALFRSAGHEAGQAKCLNAVGWFHALSGDHEAAIDHCERALELQTALGDQLAAGQTWHSLGYSHDHLGHSERSIDCYRAAVDLFRETGYRFSEAYALTSLGDAHEHAGDVDSARAVWGTALEILDQLGHLDARKVRAKLAEHRRKAEDD